MTWTTDHDGQYVDWTKPPYRQGGIVTFLLPHETRLDTAETIRRVTEYYRLVWRGKKRARLGERAGP